MKKVVFYAHNRRETQTDIQRGRSTGNIGICLRRIRTMYDSEGTLGMRSCQFSVEEQAAPHRGTGSSRVRIDDVVRLPDKVGSNGSL